MENISSGCDMENKPQKSENYFMLSLNPFYIALKVPIHCNQHSDKADTCIRTICILKQAVGKISFRFAFFFSLYQHALHCFVLLWQKLNYSHYRHSVGICCVLCALICYEMCHVTPIRKMKINVIRFLDHMHALWRCM